MKGKLYRVNPQDVEVPVSPEERATLETETIRRLYAVLREPHLSGVKEALESSDWNMQNSIAGIPGNAEGARLLSVVYAIREARRADDYREQMRDLARLHPAPVTLAVHSSLAADAAAVVVRTPGGHGVNIVVLSGTGLTAERVAHALRYLAHSRVTDGEFLRSPVRISVPSGSYPRFVPAELEFAAHAVEQLYAAVPRPVHEFGSLPAIQIEVGPVRGDPVLE